MRTSSKALPLAVSALTAALIFANNAHAAEQATIQGRVAAGQQVGFDVYLPLQHRDDLEKLISSLHDDTSPLYHKWLTPAQFHARYSAAQGTVQSITTQLRASNLNVVQISPQRIHVTGASADVERALSTQLHTGVFHSGKQRVVATTPVVAPQSIASAGAVITGLSGKVRMHAYAHRASTANRYSAAGPYWFDDLKQAYGWPSYQAYSGTGTTIGILIPSSIQAADMVSYFGHEKLKVPNISEVTVEGGAPFDPNTDNSFEAELDVQQTGGMAPNANIVVYNIPDLSDGSIMAGLAQIVEDNRADVVSISFGGPELDYTADYNDGDDYTYLLYQENDLIAQGAAQGITFVASSGDAGALSIPPNACFYTTASCGTFQASVEFPASSPYVVGVGGTNLKTTYTANNLNSAYISEEAFADPLTADIFYGTPATGGYWGSGGGNSILFPKPLYQYLVKTGSNTVRTVPDVALHMGGCPADAICNSDDSADLEYFDGALYGVIGTSASAPDFAGLTALNVQRFGTRFGNENYYIYALAAAQNIGLPLHVFHTGIPGFNGLYSTTPSGYNRVLGNGTVVGRNFLTAPLVPAAGVPQTPSNP